MINSFLLNPASIVIIGGSDDITKPGGKVLKNILDGNYKGGISVVNPKSDEIQGIKSYHSAEDIPDTDLAILAVPAKYCKDAVETLVRKKSTRAFIILSAGFGEESAEGAALEREIADIVNSVDGCLIGPNCIGVLNNVYNGIFAQPIPELDPMGVDLISGSGATSVFIISSAVPNGLRFSSVFSVGNSAQTGVEDILEYMDGTYVHGESPGVKLLYIESIANPGKLLKHASSLIRKGCRIAAIKAGWSEVGSRAASSHTGAMASSDMAVDALFRKAGIIRCYSRNELVTVAAVLMYPQPAGKRIGIVTHAGGPAVMMSDELSKNGIEVPQIKGDKAQVLLSKLFPGSSVSNPIDFLATGTAGQLEYILDACENDFDEIDAVPVVFGSPGLFPVDDVYDLLHEKMRECKKPVYPVLPALITAGREVKEFIAKGNINFPDEVAFANALAKVLNTKYVNDTVSNRNMVNTDGIRSIIENSSKGYLMPDKVQDILDAAGIKRVEEILVYTEDEAVSEAGKMGYPIVMKTVGPLHKSDVGGVVLNVDNEARVISEFRKLMNINDAVAVMMQPMIKGLELFAGAIKEGDFGHIVMAGVGGIFIEVLKDINTALVPVSEGEAREMIMNLKAYKMIEGVRGEKGVDINVFADVIIRLSALLEVAPEIVEMDINPLIAYEDSIFAVDARIKIEK